MRPVQAQPRDTYGRIVMRQTFECPKCHHKQTYTLGRTK